MPSDTEIGQRSSDDADVRPGAGSGTTSSGGPPTAGLVAAEGAQLRPLFILPVLVGVLILGLNIALAKLLGPYLNQPAAFTLVTTSALIGVALIVYGIVLWRLKWQRDRSVAWAMALPVVAALLAPAITLWGAHLARPLPPRPIPCIDLYQQASEIKAANPNFAMSPSDPDQLRCEINDALS